MSAFLKAEGYDVRMFNLLDMENSDAWNCLSEIEHNKDLVQSIAEVIIKNTSNANERQDFWEKAELNLLMALMHYVVPDCPRDEGAAAHPAAVPGGHLPDAVQRVLCRPGAAV